MAEKPNNKAPLEELMVAMDVVDTLRHRSKLVDRELDADARHVRMIEELRDIYQRQGIEVTDAMLEEGVAALEEDRFSYTPTPDSFSSKLAKLYISRDTWLKPVLVGLLGLCALWALFYVTVTRPDNILRTELPSSLEQHYQSVNKLAVDEKVRWQADQIKQQGSLALSRENYDDAEEAVDSLEAMLIQLDHVYEVHVVSRPGERSGIWRVPDTNRAARNYYLIVEAIDTKGNTMSLPISSEEQGTQRVVNKWALRVSEAVFKSISADKQNDGIIQQRVIGQKQRGYLEPSYSVQTDGSAITDW